MNISRVILITLDFFILDELSNATRLMQAVPTVTATTNTEGMMSETFILQHND